MIRNALVLAGAAMLFLATSSLSARADVDVDIDLGLGGYHGYGGGYSSDYRISCRRGIRIVERRYNRVRPRNCRGRTYVYVGTRHSKWYLIYVSSLSGRIVGVDRIRRP